MQINESLNLLSQTHPVLEKARAALVEDWAPEAPPPTILSSAFARALVSIADAATEEELLRVLTVVETILSEGDQLAKDVVATGFLEALVTAADNRASGAVRILELLGPQAAAYCEAWRTWTGG